MSILALGTHVVCSKQAFIIRREKKPGRSWADREWSGWFIPRKGNFNHPPGVVDPSHVAREQGVLFRVPVSMTPITYADAHHLFEFLPPSKRHAGMNPDRLNKSIAVIPDVASGIIVDRVKRQWGVSESQYGGGEDWEPGYFHAWGQAWLYVVKPAYGHACLYVPEDGLVPQVLA